MARTLERAIMMHLRSGRNGDRFEIDCSAVGILGRALQRDLRDPEPNDSLFAALRLAAAFDGPLASPQLARFIRELLKREPRAVAALRKARKMESALDAGRRFARREGRTVSIAAPPLETTIAEGMLPLRSFLEPGNARLERCRAQGSNSRSKGQSDGQ